MASPRQPVTVTVVERPAEDGVAPEIRRQMLDNAIGRLLRACEEQLLAELAAEEAAAERSIE